MTSTIDVYKLATWIEDLPDLDPSVSAEVLTLFRAHLAARFSHSDIEPSLRDANNIDSYLTSWEHPQQTIDNPFYITRAMGQLADTPRKLKVVLRRTEEAWRALHGEIALEDILLVNLLRYCDKEVTYSTSPDAQELRIDVFELIQAEIGWIRSSQIVTRDSDHRASDSDLSIRRRALKWLLSVRSADDPQAMLGQLIQALFPELRPTGFAALRQRPQNLTMHPTPFNTIRTDYWARLLSEDIPDGELRDQDVLRAIERFKDSTTDSRAEDQIYKWIRHDEIARAKLLQFSFRLRNHDIVSLSEGSIQAILNAFPDLDFDEHLHPRPFICLARLFGERSADRIQQHRIQIVTHYIPICMQTHPMLAHNLEYWLINRPSRTISNPDLMPRRTMIRELQARAFKDSFGPDEGLDNLLHALSLDVTSPWLLSWLIRRLWESVQAKEVGDSVPTQIELATLWSESRHILCSAAEKSPLLMIPQLCCLLEYPTQPEPRHSIDDEGNPAPEYVTDHDLDDEFAEALFQEQAERALRIIVEHEVEVEDPRVQQAIEGVRDGAQTWLSERLEN